MWIGCPSPDGHELEGCGSLNVRGPDDRGMYECNDCGLRFNFEETSIAAKVTTEGLQINAGDIEPAVKEASRIIAEGYSGPASRRVA